MTKSEPTNNQYSDPSHKSFQDGVKLAEYAKKHSEHRHLLGRVDKEIEKHRDKHFNLMKDSMQKVLLGSQVHKERIERSADHLEHLHRLKAGVMSVVEESVTTAICNDKSEHDILTDAMDTLLGYQDGQLICEKKGDVTMITHRDKNIGHVRHNGSNYSSFVVASGYKEPQYLGVHNSLEDAVAELAKFHNLKVPKKVTPDPIH